MVVANDITWLVRALRLSEGDLLGLAREVAGDGALLSVEHLTRGQRVQLVQLLEFLAEPCVAV